MNNDQFSVLRIIKKFPLFSQRKLAIKIGFSLGKLNYCLKGLQERGYLKFKYFKKNPNKLHYLYVLTPKGIAAKTKITIDFMKRKIREYDELKAEIEEEK